MSDDYLWDGSGQPDPELARLERLLSRFRHNRPAPELPESFPGFYRGMVGRLMPRIAAVAAMLLLIIVGVWLVKRPSEPLREFARPSAGQPQVGPNQTAEADPAASQPSWEVARLEGAPKVGPDRTCEKVPLSKRMGEKIRLAVGEWLETDGASRARISVSTMGKVEVQPNTRLRLLGTGPTEHRLALERGTIHATIWAPPRLFYVETPSATAVDLGCVYTLAVDDSGAGLLRVTSGWVGFELHGRESFIPAGAYCATRPGIGPGTPYYKDVSDPFRAALATIDFEPASPEARAKALSVVLARARRRDALTLWHLLSRTDGDDRSRVYDRMAALVPPPKGVTREGVLRGEQHMLDLWWDRLGLGKTSWWRTWKGAWPPQAR